MSASIQPGSPVSGSSGSITKPGGPYDFRLALPATWIRLDLNPRSRKDNIDKLVRERLAAEPNAKKYWRAVASLLDQVAVQAVDSGAVRAWLYTDRIGDKPLSATLLVSIAPFNSHREGMAPVDLISERLSRHGAAGGRSSSTSIVDLPTGLGVRFRRRLPVDIPGAGKSVEAETVQYWVPVPGVDAVLVLSFSSPILPLAESFVELFDAIAGTLQWREERESGESNATG